jgi:hypothetical protein
MPSCFLTLIPFPTVVPFLTVVPIFTVIPAEAGIQCLWLRAKSLGPGLRRGDDAVVVTL